MKSTGIVRRIDDLGRVVVPKEIRRSLNIKDGDPLELFLDGDKFYFQKYIPTEEYSSSIDHLIRILKEDDYSVPNKDKVLLALEIAKDLLKGEENNG